jgi:isocitrate/isopropylmalate dehydrogenase
MWLAPDGSRTPGSEIVAVGGDGIGPETVRAALACMRAMDPTIPVLEWLCHEEDSSKLVAPGASTDAEKEAALPSWFRERVDQSGAVLFGAADTNRGLGRHVLRYLRWTSEAGTWANVRPTVALPGIPHRTGTNATNLVIVRELSEGEYVGAEGALSDFSEHWPDFRDRFGRSVPTDGNFALKVVTPEATRRVARYAGELAAHRRRSGWSRGHVTIVGKKNVLPRTGALFEHTCREELAEVDGISVDYLYVDEAARRLVACPESFDVIVTTNLFGDILSDVACEAMGGLPIAPSASIGSSFCYFEPVHGSAPELAGEGVANPAATMLAGCMALQHLGRESEAERMLQAIIETLQSDVRTADLNGTASTHEFTEKVVTRIKKS